MNTQRLKAMLENVKKTLVSETVQVCDVGHDGVGKPTYTQVLLESLAPSL